VEGWETYFDTVDVIFTNLRSLIVASPPSNFGRYLPALKRNFGKHLESLTSCMVTFVADEVYFILASFPHLRNLEISHSSQVPLGAWHPKASSENLIGLRTRGRLSLVGLETHSTYIPLFIGIPEL
jgi:hypothetical protein